MQAYTGEDFNFATLEILRQLMNELIASKIITLDVADIVCDTAAHQQAINGHPMASKLIEYFKTTIKAVHI